MAAAPPQPPQQQQQTAPPPPAKKKRSRAASALSGSLSGALVSACVQPLDVVRTRMQADVGRGIFRSTLQTMHTVVAEVGAMPVGSGAGEDASLSNPFACGA